MDPGVAIAAPGEVIVVDPEVVSVDQEGVVAEEDKKGVYSSCMNMLFKFYIRCAHLSNAYVFPISFLKEDHVVT